MKTEEIIKKRVSTNIYVTMSLLPQNGVVTNVSGEDTEQMLRGPEEVVS